MTLNLTVTTSSLNCEKYFQVSSENFTPLCRAIYEKKFFVAISLIKNGANVNESSKVLVNPRLNPTQIKEITPLEIGLYRLKKIKNKIKTLVATKILCENILEISRSKINRISKAEQKEALIFYKSLPEEIKKHENLSKEAKMCITLLKVCIISLPTSYY